VCDRLVQWRNWLCSWRWSTAISGKCRRYRYRYSSRSICGCSTSTSAGSGTHCHNLSV